MIRESFKSEISSQLSKWCASCSLLRQLTWIRIAADDLTTLCAIYGFLDTHLITMFILHLYACFSCNKYVCSTSNSLCVATTTRAWVRYHHCWGMFDPIKSYFSIALFKSSNACLQIYIWNPKFYTLKIILVPVVAYLWLPTNSLYLAY